MKFALSDFEIIRAHLAAEHEPLTSTAIELAKTLPCSAESVQRLFDDYAERFGESAIAEVLQGLARPGVDGAGVLREMNVRLLLSEANRNAEFRRAASLGFHAGAVRETSPGTERLDALLRGPR